MTTKVKDLLAAANAVVPKITHDDVRKLIGEKNALVVDVRDMPKLLGGGKIRGALHVPRGAAQRSAAKGGEVEQA